jgi:hypothetical protein
MGKLPMAGLRLPCKENQTDLGLNTSLATLQL